MDGELSPEQEREVQQRINEDPDWARAYRQLQDVDTALGQWEVPATPNNLASRIIRNSKPKTLLLRAVRWVTPLAAAAIVVLMVLSMWQSKTTQGGGAVAKSGSVQQRRQQVARPVVYRVPNAQEQARLLENYSKRMQFKQQWMARNEWLLVVLSSFTPEELKELKNLPQDEVTQRIIQRRDKLVKQGILKRVPNSR